MKNSNETQTTGRRHFGKVKACGDREKTADEK